MKRATQLLFLLPLLLVNGCAQWSPFVKDSKLNRAFGYPSQQLGKLLEIPTMDRLRVEDFQDEVEQ